MRVENKAPNAPNASPITAEGIIESGVFTAQQEEVPLAKRVYADCPHSIACLILAMYVDNNGVRTNCKTLVDEFLLLSRLMVAYY